MSNLPKCSCGYPDRILSDSGYAFSTCFIDYPNKWWYGYELNLDTGIAQVTLYRLLEKFYKKGILEFKEERKSNRIRKLYRLNKSHMHCLKNRKEDYEIEKYFRDLN